jgi:Uma2 family endonuclease
LYAMPDDGFRYELVQGDLIRMSPAGDEHGEITVKITAPLFDYVNAHNLGKVYAAETGFLIRQDPDSVRAPDVAFVSRQRIEAAGRIKSYRIGAPDLAVEVLSPGDSARYIESKVMEWLDAGARVVWVVSPKGRTVTVYSVPTTAVVLTEHDILDGGEVVPGFQILVADLFPALQ